MLLPKDVHNRGNYIISLGELCTWLGERAEEVEVDVICGYAADKILYNE